MNMKLISVGVAALFALAALPTANASSANDALTRTFDATVFVELEFKDRGLGIYDANGNQVCPISLLGLRLVVSDAFYYQRDREDNNLKTGLIPVTSPIGMGPGIGPCPIPGTAPDPQFIWVPDFNVKLAFSAVTVDQLLCGQQSFLDCFPDPSTAYMSIYKCDGETFTNQRPDDNKGLLGGTGIDNLLLSREISCTGTSNALVYLDAPNGVNTDCDFDFGEGSWGTGFCLPQTNDHVPYGTGSGYIVSCASVTYDWFDFTAIPPVSGSANGKAHDYKLILDLAAPIDWDTAKLTHWGTTGQVDHVALAGWNDLGGSNGCPAMPTGPAYDADAKKANSAVTPTNCTAFDTDGQLPPPLLVVRITIYCDTNGNGVPDPNEVIIEIIIILPPGCTADDLALTATPNLIRLWCDTNNNATQDPGEPTVVEVRRR